MTQHPFTTAILQWYHFNKRDLPWRKDNDPYKIWLSEIILQQTRVAQGLPYYNIFFENYKTINAFAKAPLSEILFHWQGLGYYSRARNMHHCANEIATQYDGAFPDKYESLIKLKGIGTYTAAAIASIAFGRSHAVVDGNVYRVLSRYFGITTPIDSTEGKNTFSNLAHELLPTAEPGNYNQAIMDFGALQCKPALPQCDKCPLAEQCVALREGKVNLLPIKSKKIKIKKRYFHFLHIAINNAIVIEQRNTKDIWHSLYQLPLLETNIQMDLTHGYLKKENFELPIKKISKPMIELEHKLTHQHIVAKFYKVELSSNEVPEQYIVTENKETFAFPKLITNYLKKIAGY
ncbi:MAG: hypothetical protein RIQ89_2426 [Bacteroidota bacterium]